MRGDSIARGRGAIHIPRQDNPAAASTATIPDEISGPRGHGAIHLMSPKPSGAPSDDWSSLTAPAFTSISGMAGEQSSPKGTTRYLGRGGEIDTLPPSSGPLRLDDKEGDRSWYDF